MSAVANSIQNKPLELFERAILQCPTGIRIADPSGVVIFQNESARRLFGRPDKELIGRYNILEDKQLIRQGVIPSIKRVFEQVGSAELTVEYVMSGAPPEHWQKTLRVFLFSVADETGRVRNVVLHYQDYTEHWQVQKSLEEAETRYRDLVEFSPDAITIHSEGKIVFTNAAGAALLGASSPEELVGRPVLDFVHPDYRETVKQRIRQMIEKRVKVPLIEEKFIKLDGSAIDVEVAAMPVTFEGKPAALVMTRDITERKCAEEALTASEANYRAIFDAANDAIFVHDMQTGAILDVNWKMCDMYGYTPEEARRLTVGELSSGEPPYTQADALQWIRKAVEGEPQLFEWNARDKSGSLFWVEVNLKHAVIGGEDRLLAVVRDVTERKSAEERQVELDQHKRDFYRRTILAATEGKLQITERAEIDKIAGPPIASWKIKRGEDLGVIRHAVGRIAQSMGMDEARIFDLVLCAGEATTNALKHAGRGAASLHEITGGLMLVVSDRGPGIDALTLPEVSLKRGYSTSGSLGMGYKAILSVADKVYLATGPMGTTVAIEMKLQEVEKPLAVAGLPDTWLT
jgi:PAS domain S-box-containing protein